MRIKLDFDGAEVGGIPEAIRDGDVTRMEVPLKDGRILRLIASLEGGAVDAFWFEPANGSDRWAQLRSEARLRDGHEA